jgi:hypothetical protein
MRKLLNGACGLLNEYWQSPSWIPAGEIGDHDDKWSRGDVLGFALCIVILGLFSFLYPRDENLDALINLLLSFGGILVGMILIPDCLCILFIALEGTREEG